MRLPLLILHILCGTLALPAGTVAAITRKGDRAHRLSGNVFTMAMLTLATSGFCLAAMKSQMSNILAAVLTFYLVASAWLAGRARERTGILEWAGLFFCVAALSGVLTFGIHALHTATGSYKGLPAPVAFVFSGILLLAAGGDVRMLARKRITGRARIVRHLWRMCVAFFIATGSFFLGQPQIFPRALRGSIYLIVPAVLPFVLLVFWLIRVRFAGAYQLRPPMSAMPLPAFKQASPLEGNRLS